jgi:hypothetical protein
MNPRQGTLIPMGGPQAHVELKTPVFALAPTSSLRLLYKLQSIFFIRKQLRSCKDYPPPVLGSSQGRRADFTHVQTPITDSYWHTRGYYCIWIVALPIISGMLHWQSDVRDLTWSSWVAKTSRTYKERAPQNSDALPNSPPPRTALGHDTTSGLRHKQILSLSMTNGVMCSDNRTASTVLEPARSGG